MVSSYCKGTRLYNQSEGQKQVLTSWKSINKYYPVSVKSSVFNYWFHNAHNTKESTSVFSTLPWNWWVAVSRGNSNKVCSHWLHWWEHFSLKKKKPHHVISIWQPACRAVSASVKVIWLWWLSSFITVDQAVEHLMQLLTAGQEYVCHDIGNVFF